MKSWLPIFYPDGAVGYRNYSTQQQPPHSQHDNLRHQTQQFDQSQQQLRAQIADRFALTSVWGNLQETAREALADTPSNFAAKHSVPLATQQLALHAAFRDVVTRAPSDYHTFQTASAAYLESLVAEATAKKNDALVDWAHEVARMLGSPTALDALYEVYAPNRALKDARARRGDAADPTTTPAGLQQAASALINASHRFHEKQDKLTDGAQPEAAKALQRRLDAAHIEPAGWEYLRALGGPELEAAVWAASKELPAEAESIARTVRELAARRQMDAAALMALGDVRVDVPATSTARHAVATSTARGDGHGAATPSPVPAVQPASGTHPQLLPEKTPDAASVSRKEDQQLTGAEVPSSAVSHHAALLKEEVPANTSDKAPKATSTCQQDYGVPVERSTMAASVPSSIVPAASGEPIQLTDFNVEMDGEIGIAVIHAVVSNDVRALCANARQTHEVVASGGSMSAEMASPGPQQSSRHKISFAKSAVDEIERQVKVDADGHSRSVGDNGASTSAAAAVAVQEVPHPPQQATTTSNLAETEARTCQSITTTLRQLQYLEVTVLPELVNAITPEHRLLYTTQLDSLLSTIAQRPEFVKHDALGGFLRAFHPELENRVRICNPHFYSEVLQRYENVLDVWYGMYAPSVQRAC